jgi:hypothetical protein
MDLLLTSCLTSLLIYPLTAGVREGGMGMNNVLILRPARRAGARGSGLGSPFGFLPWLRRDPQKRPRPVGIDPQVVENFLYISNFLGRAGANSGRRKRLTPAPSMLS